MKKIKICESNIIHIDVIKSARKKLPGKEVIMETADLFKVFGDETRVKILMSLLISEMCVCDLSALLEMNSSAISHQLRILKQAKLVKYRKEGKVVYYSIADDHIDKIINLGVEHIKE